MVEFLVCDSEVFGAGSALSVAVAGVPWAVVCPVGPIVGSAVGGNSVYPCVSVGDLAGVGGGLLDDGVGAVVWGDDWGDDWWPGDPDLGGAGGGPG